MTIQIVEDDKALSEGISISISDAADNFYKEYTIESARLGFMKYGSEINLIILDLNLPDGSGYDYLKYVREHSDVPVLILTANDMEMDEVTGLTMGADDFLTKPFSLAVLRARVNALIRRSRISGNTETSGNSGNLSSDKAAVYEIDDMIFDFDKLVFKKGEEENSQYYTLGNTRSRSAAFFGTGTYSYKGRYQVTGTYRYEGTNSLGKARKSRWMPTSRRP